MRLEARRLILLTAVLAQRDIWRLYQAVAQAVLRREKDIHDRSQAGLEPKTYKEPPRVLAATGASFPPSRRVLNFARKYKVGKGRTNQAAFDMAARTMEIPPASRPAVWPIILGSKGLTVVQALPSCSPRPLPTAEAPTPVERAPGEPAHWAPPNSLLSVYERQRQRILEEAGVLPPSPQLPAESAPRDALTGPRLRKSVSWNASIDASNSHPRCTNASADALAVTHEAAWQKATTGDDLSATSQGSCSSTLSVPPARRPIENDQDEPVLPPATNVEGPWALPEDREPLTAAENAAAAKYISSSPPLVSLSPGLPVIQDVVDRALQAFLKRDTGTYRIGALSSDAGVLLIGSHQWHPDQERHRVPAFQKILKFIKAYDFTMLPCVHEGHWIGLVLERPRDNHNRLRVHVVNSIQTLGNTAVLTGLYNLLDGPVAVAMGYDHFFREKELIITLTKQQDSAPDCAVIMLHTIMSLVSRDSHVPSPTIGSWPTSHLRAWVALLLLMEARNASGARGQTKAPPS